MGFVYFYCSHYERPVVVNNMMSSKFIIVKRIIIFKPTYLFFDSNAIIVAGLSIYC